MANEFAERLRLLRKQRNLSQTDLAQRVGLHYNQIGRYERGESNPTADAIRRLAEVLDVSTDYLIEGKAEAAAKARFEDRDLLRQFQEVEQLPDAEKVLVKGLLDAVLFKHKVQGLTARTP